MKMASIDYESGLVEASESSSSFGHMESKSMMQSEESRSAISATQNNQYMEESSSHKQVGESMKSMTKLENHAEMTETVGKSAHSRKHVTEKKMAARREQRHDGQDVYEENSMSRERTLSWQNSGDGSMGNGEELRLKADAGNALWVRSAKNQDCNGEGEQEGDGICWHHINYRTAEEEKHQPEFLKARLKKTSFGVMDRRRKSSGSDTSSR